MNRRLSNLVRGIALAAIAAAIPAAVAACGTASGQQAPAKGQVTGKFVREGGPIRPGGQQPRVVRLAGLVEFSAPDRKVVMVRVGNDGTFTVSLAPGKYAVSGHSPSIEQAGNGAGSGFPCSAPSPVTVTSGQTAKVTVVCAVP